MSKFVMGAALVLASLASAPAMAQAPAAAPVNDEVSQKLAECVTTKATAEDKAALAKWVAVEIASTPVTAGAATIDAEKKTAFDKDTAHIFTRLVTVDCVEYTKVLAKSGGAAAFRAAGAAISRLAIRELIATPGVNSAIVRSYVTNLNQDDFRRVMQP
ncbi:hypothetical protein EOE18_04860 [Novosphingobium umbonatum]|uniref:Uncharacterized protein n=1 Tax=Novosphingobium umbonatum TaxID=1908524 RepID=A0A3S2Y8V0_9SPHN|nr:hypothetical protein [Novosphingobium umbonatum]RVU06175.1 hypothetical protein EOE18_04860 [Novosphingobium umbonatum]